MGKVANILGLFGDVGQTNVERAISEFRSGRPVVLRKNDDALIAIGVEAFDAGVAAAVEAFAKGRGRLVLPAARLRRLGREAQEPGSLAFPVVDLERIETLSLKLDARVDAPVKRVTDLETMALELAALSLTLPGVFVVDVEGAAPAGLVSVSADDVRGYRSAATANLQLVSRSPVPLEYASKAEFVVFRGGEGLRDQVAIIVGEPDLKEPVAVRLHSACLTGDLFGSLKCDCGDQLRHTVKNMAEGEGGILLYLDQEGRGNGIANKMRAYKLQSQGWDTYDADEALGFDLDQRHFDFAADMLKQLGVTSVKVMTNNPIKIGALKGAGLDVASDARVLGRATAENVRYLASKRDRAGHFIDFETMTALARQQD
ncbi:MAG TPA: GTP cyclohydrolase II RibA [Beijerinckiaceae bacterium]|nr:GTP cyclohydrolase II RibA [Beijerinckiaceae bacterium]